MYTRDYQRRIRNVFVELSLFEQDQLVFLQEMETFNLNFLYALYGILNEAHVDTDFLSDVVIDSILTKFANHSNLSAISFLRVAENQNLYCSHSTIEDYEGKDFTKFFSLAYLETVHDNIFIAKDPIFGHSLFLTYLVRGKSGGITGVIIASVSIEKLIQTLNSRRNLYDTYVSIIDRDKTVIGSSEKSLMGQRFYIQQDEKIESDIAVEKMDGVKNGYQFEFGNARRFAVISHFPNTASYLMVSAPAHIVLMQMYDHIWHLSIFLLFILIVGGVGSYLFTIRLSRPLKKLSEVMTIVGKGNLEERFQHDSMGFEINYLGNRFNEMVVSLIDHIEEANKERASKEAYATELQIGHEIQQSILPKKEDEFPGLEVGVYFKPAKEVAGDFYDWIIRDNKVIITIADGVGKGVSGALYSFDLRSILRTFAMTEDNIETVVRETNKLFMIDTKDTGNFVTAFTAVYDCTNGLLKFVNCGHNHPFVKPPSGEIERLILGGIAFGVDDFDEVEVGERSLALGDFVVFFTDGVSEAQNTKEELFGEERLEQVIRDSSSKTPDELIKEIIDAVNVFTDGADQYDDMTLIVLTTKEFTNPGGDS